MAGEAPGDTATTLLKRVAEVLSLLSGGAFLLSALINSAIFYGWGVTFLAIATPIDVVMSGLQLLLYALLLLAAIALIATALLSEDSGWTGPRARKVRTWVIKGLSWAAVIPAAIVLWELRSGDRLPDLSLAQHIQIVAGCALAVIVLNVLGDLSTDDPAPSLFEAMRHHFDGTRPIEAIKLGGAWLFGTMFLGSGAVLLASIVAQVGFVPSKTWFDGPGDTGCAPLHVLWIGQSTVLVDCPADGQVRVLARSGGVLRVSEKRPPPFAARPSS